MADVDAETVARLTRELKEAHEALQPFALAAEHYSPYNPDSWGIARCLSVGDLRRARGVLQDG